LCFKIHKKITIPKCCLKITVSCEQTQQSHLQRLLLLLPLLPLPLPKPKLLLTPRPGLHLTPQRRLLMRSLQRPKLTPLSPQNRERPLLVLYNC
jgi:hypothetical protein